MADHGEVEYATATGNDYPLTNRPTRISSSWVKVVMTIVVIILVGMAYFLT